MQPLKELLLYPRIFCVSFSLTCHCIVKRKSLERCFLNKNFSHIYSLFYCLATLSKGDSSLTDCLLNSLWSSSSYTSDKRIYLFNELTSRFHNTNESAIAFLILSILVRVPLPVIFYFQHSDFLNLTGFYLLLTDLFLLSGSTE